MLITFIIDDDKLYQFGVKRILQHHLSVNTEIKQFYDGQEAIDYLQQNKNEKSNLPDVIFLDINMPVMNGWQFLDAFIDMHLNPDKQITIYMISSSVSHAEISRASSYKEIKNYIIKPIGIESIKEIFSNLEKR